MDLTTPPAPAPPARRAPDRFARTALAVAAVIAAALAVRSLGAAAPPGGAPAENPFAASLWDDGRAEYSVYEGVTRRYGEPRPTEARMIVVKEDLLRASLVKSDQGPIPGKTLTAIKMNFSADFLTGTYTYHQAATVMFDRADLAPIKEVMAHHELCGITFVRIAPDHGRLVHHASSYWEGEAERTVEIHWPAGVALWWDALPVSLRPWAGSTRSFQIPVWLLPTQISGRSPLSSTQPVRATLTRMDGGPLTVPAGTFQSVKLAVATADGADVFWFDVRAPHPLLRVDTHEGRSLQLKKLLRLDYWNHHANGDEKLVE